MSPTHAIQAMFVLYALIACAAGLVYRGLPRALDASGRSRRRRCSNRRSTVYTLAALFSLDAFGGGFVVQSMVALWLYQRFDAVAGGGRRDVLLDRRADARSPISSPCASPSASGWSTPWCSRTCPSSLCLIPLPFVPDLGYAIALLFVRSALSQMDVPTRSSYVMAIVTPAERPAAASITSVPRSLASAVSPFLAGWMLGAVGVRLAAARGGRREDRLRPAAARDVPTKCGRRKNARHAIRLRAPRAKISVRGLVHTPRHTAAHHRPH